MRRFQAPAELLDGEFEKLDRRARLDARQMHQVNRDRAALERRQNDLQLSLVHQPRHLIREHTHDPQPGDPRR